MQFPTDILSINLNVSSFCCEFDEAVEEWLACFRSNGEKGVEAVG